MVKIFISCGEASGDLLGASIIEELKKHISSLESQGIGGEELQKQGLSSLFPMADLSVMGVVEIIPHLFHLTKRIRQTARSIIDFQPDIVLSVDAPDFNFRVVKKIRSLGFKGKCIHVVAPSVWAWRPKRAKKIAKIYDHLLCLLPFEPPYFEKEGLLSTFIGHPIADQKYCFPPQENNPLALLLPGSRVSEIERHLPLFLKVFERLHLDFPQMRISLPLAPKLRGLVEKYLKDSPLLIELVEDPLQKKEIMRKATVALAVSGTVTLELAYLRIPTVVAYKTSRLTYLLAKLLVKVKYISLVNIVADKQIYPEFIQGNCHQDALYKTLYTLLKDDRLREHQQDVLEKAILQFKNESFPSSATGACQVIMNTISCHSIQKRD